MASWISDLLKDVVDESLTETGAAPVSLDLLQESTCMDLFIKYFIHKSKDGHPGLGEMDDMLFFVKASNTQSVIVRRRPSDGSMPQLDDIIDWKSSLALNCITQLQYVLVVSVCNSETPNIVCQISCPVYAIPGVPKHYLNTNASTGSSDHDNNIDFGSFFQDAYPWVYFTIHDFDQVFKQLSINHGEYLCIELIYYIPGSKNSDLGAQRIPGKSIGTGQVNLFQGAVSWSALWKAYQVKQEGISQDKRKRNKLYDADTSMVLMRGPDGKGHAQVSIQRSDSPESLNTNRGFGSFFSLNLFGNGNMSARSTNMDFGNPALQCQLTFIRLHCDSIIKDILSTVRVMES
jgi:hypothetical protein